MKVQRYKDYDATKVKYPCLVSIKMNGNWGRRTKDKWISRQDKPYHGLSYLDSELAKITSTLDGELLIPGKDFETSNGLIRNHVGVPDACFYIFDAPFYDVAFKKRYEVLSNSQNLKLAYNVFVLEHHWIKDETELDLFYHAAIGINKEEGIVICDPEAFYTHGRSYAKMKRCPVLRIELEILDAYEGKGKMESMLGGYICRGLDWLPGMTVKVGGAQKGVWDYEERTRLWGLWCNNKTVPGSRIKVMYKAKTKYGSLQQPKLEAFI